MKIQLLKKLVALCLVLLVSGFAWGMTPLNSCGDKDKDKDKETETFVSAVFTAETDGECEKGDKPGDKEKEECDKDKGHERKECPNKDKDKA